MIDSPMPTARPWGIIPRDPSCNPEAQYGILLSSYPQDRVSHLAPPHRRRKGVLPPGDAPTRVGNLSLLTDQTRPLMYIDNFSFFLGYR